MQSFCEASALRFDECSMLLVVAFEVENQAIAGSLHNAFVSYHVGIRQDGINARIELVNKRRELPALSAPGRYVGNGRPNRNDPQMLGHGDSLRASWWRCGGGCNATRKQVRGRVSRQMFTSGGNMARNDRACSASRHAVVKSLKPISF
jgi:hypothetical protein